jgi:hypothetical protein
LISLGFGNRSSGSRTFVNKNANLRWLIAWGTLGNGAARIATGGNTMPPRDPDEDEADEDEEDRADEPPVVREPDED